MDYRQQLKRLIDAIERRDADAYAQCFAEQCRMHHPLAPTPLEGRAAIHASEAELFAAFSDIQVEVVSMVGEGRTAAVEVVLRATHSGDLDLGPDERLAATGRRVELRAVWWFEFGADGLLIAERDYFDTAGFMAQLTAMASP